jgi:hypothetical protein
VDFKKNRKTVGIAARRGPARRGFSSSPVVARVFDVLKVQVRRKWSMVRRHMTDSFLSYSNGWDLGVTNVNRLSGLSVAFQSHAPLLSTTRKTTFLDTTQEHYA